MSEKSLETYPAPTPDDLRAVDDLPRRTAHAIHGLLVASLEHGMPVTAAEVQVYDEEAIRVQATGKGLSHARRLGYAMYTGRYWIPSSLAHNLKSKFEDRYLSDTAGELQ